MEINNRVCWIETYRTNGDVIAQRQMWGTVIDIYQNGLEHDGHSIKGTYVKIKTLTGDVVSVFHNHIVLVQKV